MNISIIIFLIAALFIISVQSMTIGHHTKINNIKDNVKKNQQAVFRTIPKCEKLRVKLMFKYRSKPRILRRISKLKLKC